MFALVRRHHPIARIAAFAVLFAAIFSGAGVARTLHVLIAHGGGACGTIVCDGKSTATPTPCDGTRATSACGLDAITRAVRGHAHGDHDHDHDHDRNHHHQPHDCAICLELALLVPGLSLVAPFVPFSEPVALADEPIRIGRASPAAPEACAARPPPLRA